MRDYTDKSMFYYMEKELARAMMNNPKVIKYELSIDFYTSYHPIYNYQEFLFRLYSIKPEICFPVEKFLSSAVLNNPLFSYENLVNMMVYEWENKRRADHILRNLEYMKERNKELMPKNVIEIPSEHIRDYMKMLDNDLETYIINGSPVQEIDILIEECSELIKALSKFKRGLRKPNSDPDPKLIMRNIAEELTHVAISSEVIARRLDISKEDILYQVKEKNDRLAYERG